MIPELHQQAERVSCGRCCYCGHQVFKDEWHTWLGAQPMHGECKQESQRQGSAKVDIDAWESHGWGSPGGLGR